MTKIRVNGGRSSLDEKAIPWTALISARSKIYLASSSSAVKHECCIVEEDEGSR